MNEPVVPADLNTFDVQFPTTIAEPDDVFYRVTTDAFEYNGIVCLVKNRLKTNQLAIFDLDDNIIVDNVGSYNQNNGIVSFVGFEPVRILSGTNDIKITITTNNESSIKPLRNMILRLEQDKSSATAIIDRQTATLEVS